MPPVIISVAVSVVCFTVYAWQRWGADHPGAGAPLERFVAAGGVLLIAVGVVGSVVGLGVTYVALALTLGPHRGDSSAPGVILLCTTVLAVPLAPILLGTRARRGGVGGRDALFVGLGLCCLAIAVNRGPQTGVALIAGAITLCAASLAVLVVSITQRLRAAHR
jgi:hypothetical protein